MEEKIEIKKILEKYSDFLDTMALNNKTKYPKFFSDFYCNIGDIMDWERSKDNYSFGCGRDLVLQIPEKLKKHF